MKTCTKCGESKPLDLFRKQASQKSGLTPHCKACAKVYGAAYYEKNKEKLLAGMRDKYAENPQPFLDSMKEWRRKNPDKKRELGRKAYHRLTQEGKAHAQQINRQWAKRNKVAVLAFTLRRKATRRTAETAWEPDLDRLVEIEAAHLAKLRETAFGFKWHVDHTVPLRSKLVCGLHNTYNLAVIPATENLRKGNRYWPDMPC